MRRLTVWPIAEGENPFSKGPEGAISLPWIGEGITILFGLFEIGEGAGVSLFPEFGIGEGEGTKGAMF